MNRYLTLYLIYLIVFLCGCGSGAGPEQIDDVLGTFDQNPTYELRLHGGLLYAGTEGGLFRKPVDLSASNWESLGLGNATIRTFLVFSGQEVLASANYQDRSKNTIAKTTDNGQTWIRFRNGYSGNINNRVPRAMVKNPSEADIIFAGGPGGLDVAKSLNRGNSWELKLGSWENLGFLNFLNIDKRNPDNLWAGGINSVFEPYLVKSVNAGKTWTSFNNELQILDETVFEASSNDLLINYEQPSQVLLGLSVGIFRSNDGGAKWDSVYTNASIETFTIESNNSQIIYASGRNAAGSLFFIRSDDFGGTWQEVVVPGAPKDIAVNDMVSVIVGGREILYFATNKGVYSYRFEE